MRRSDQKLTRMTVGAVQIAEILKSLPKDELEAVLDAALAVAQRGVVVAADEPVETQEEFALDFDDPAVKKLVAGRCLPDPQTVGRVAALCPPGKVVKLKTVANKADLSTSSIFRIFQILHMEKPNDGGKRGRWVRPT